MQWPDFKTCKRRYQVTCPYCGKDICYTLLSETMHTITWDGEIPPRSFGIELVAA